MLELPNVTLLCVETLFLRLAKLAMEDCLRAARFGAVVVCGAEPFGLPGERFVPAGPFPTTDAYRAFVYPHLYEHFNTSHVLWVDYDSWIIDPGMWTEAFLDYDFIGAPWWYDDGLNVGAGSFSLWSHRLLAHVAKNPDRYPLATDPQSDSNVGRKYRPALEADGFRWAPEALAYRFSFERTRPAPNSRHFGFHDVFNWPLVLDRPRLIERLALLDPYHLKRGKVEEVMAVIQALDSASLVAQVKAARRAAGLGTGPFDQIVIENPSVTLRQPK